MGTRASFWVGDPRDMEHRVWLGCVAWDGYPDGLPELKDVQSLNDFHRVILGYSERDDFAHPGGGWPYPWAGDVFLTDYTYAWINDRVLVSCFHQGWRTFAEQLAGGDEEPDDPTFVGVPAPTEYHPDQPDSIMIILARGGNTG